MADRAQRVSVASIDAGAFLQSLHDTSDFVALKMDIEGFEFKLVDHLLNRHREAVCGVRLWAIEFHERLSALYHGHAEKLKKEMHKCGTLVLLDWH